VRVIPVSTPFLSASEPVGEILSELRNGALGHTLRPICPRAAALEDPVPMLIGSVIQGIMHSYHKHTYHTGLTKHCGVGKAVGNSDSEVGSLQQDVLNLHVDVDTRKWF